MSNRTITEHGTLDRNGTLQLDKNDAELLGLIKLDILGLRTLTILNDCLSQIGKDVDYLLKHPLDDAKVFEVFNNNSLGGIFQFEGESVRRATEKMGVQNFGDLVHLTTIVRPGPNQEQDAFINRRKGREEQTPLHESLAHITKETFGILLYQEQLMEVCREAGFTWPEVSEVRRLMSKSKGFEKYQDKFINGFDNITKQEATMIWVRLVTFGKYAFNKSHAVSYSMITYWCAILKTYYPLEFFTSCLRYPKEEADTLRMLREVVAEGFSYKPVDLANPTLNWAVVDGNIIGGLTNIKGMGEKKAQNLIDRLESGADLTPSQKKVMKAPVTPYDDVFECETRFGKLYENPTANGLSTPVVHHINTINKNNQYVFIGKVTDKTIKSTNGEEYCSVVIEDDTGVMNATVPRRIYKNLNVIDKDEYYVFKGSYAPDYGRVFLDKWICPPN